MYIYIFASTPRIKTNRSIPSVAVGDPSFFARCRWIRMWQIRAWNTHITRISVLALVSHADGLANGSYAPFSPHTRLPQGLWTNIACYRCPWLRSARRNEYRSTYRSVHASTSKWPHIHGAMHDQHDEYVVWSGRVHGTIHCTKCGWVQPARGSVTCVGSISRTSKHLHSQRA